MKSNLDPLGRRIIDCCLSNGNVQDYEEFMPGVDCLSS
ncbi:MAG: hypothetical protein ACRC2T_05070 [Thermoguttaceae bacterium]